MFYRQKFLLALLQKFGGKLYRTDLEKLLFLYCKKTGCNHYDFIPYKYGPFSFTSYEDQRKLISKNWLKDEKHFEVNTEKMFIDTLDVKDKAELHRFTRQFANIKGRELIRKSYLEYPQYAMKSKVAKEILSPDEYDSVKKLWEFDTQETLFTVGYEGISIDTYLYKLISNNVKILIDVRKNPLSRKHGFSRKQLKSYVEKVDIKYQHLPELGISSHLRQSLDDKESYATLFEHYASEILPHQGESIDSLKGTIESYKRVAITCFEAEHTMCHRHKISERIEKDNINIPIIHL